MSMGQQKILTLAVLLGMLFAVSGFDCIAMDFGLSDLSDSACYSLPGPDAPPAPCMTRVCTCLHCLSFCASQFAEVVFSSPHSFSSPSVSSLDPPDVFATPAGFPPEHA